MEWQDEGLIIGVKRHGESSVILELMTKYHGRHLGLVRGGRRMASILQVGNFVTATWKARLADQLGYYAIEPALLYASRHLHEASALHGMSYVSSLLHLLPERDLHHTLFEEAQQLIEHLHLPLSAPLMVHFELSYLSDLGFGLDLSSCAATGVIHDLIYVSPKSGRAVSRDAGEPYKSRLLPLPAFLCEPICPEGLTRVSFAQTKEGFTLMQYFLLRDVFHPRGLLVPSPREAYLNSFMSKVV